MSRSLAAALAVVLFSTTALAQSEFEGLDLTDEGKKSEESKAGETPAPAPTPPPAEPSGEAKPPAKPADVALLERDITQEDRVKSVQRKLYLKRYRVELAPYALTSVNDAFYTKYGFAVRAAFYLADSLALSARGSYYWLQPTADVRTAKRNFGSRIFYSLPQWSVMGDLEWSPIYGKVSFMNSILHFDAYVLGGLGAVRTETASVPGRGMSIGTDLGLGMRFVAKDFLAVNLALINTSYVDQPTGTTKGSTANLLCLHAGFSLFIPFKSTFREEE